MTMSRETRLKLHVGESRIWNMDRKFVRRQAYMLNFMRSD